MEDQPTDSGDLTTDAAEAPSTATPRRRHRMPSGKKLRTAKPEPAEPQAAPHSDETVVEETAPAVEEAPVAEATGDETDSEAAESTDEAAELEEGQSEDEEAVLVPHRPAGRRLKLAAAAAAVLFVAGGAFLGATAQPVIANRALVDTKLDIARTAANAITTLWSYTPENMDSLGERSAKYLTGDFAFQYRKFIDSIVATNKQAQVTNTTSVLGSAVESVGPTEASAVVYTNSVATSPVSKNIPSLRYLSYRLEMTRDRTDWRIARMTTITTLDLTPQL